MSADWLAHVRSIEHHADGWAVAGLILGYTLSCFGARSFLPTNLWEGFDGRPSTSKFQFFVWTLVVAFAYCAITAARYYAGLPFMIDTIPQNVLIALGLSVTTATAAKVIATNAIANNQTAKPAIDTTQCNSPGGLLVDDFGVADLSKIQLLVWTAIAVFSYLYLVFHQIDLIANLSPYDIDLLRGVPPGYKLPWPSQNDLLPRISLPDIDTTLLVLMGLGHSAYLGKKIASNGNSIPIISAVTPSPLPTASIPTTPMTISGVSFGDTQNGGQVLLNDTPLSAAAITAWKDTSIQITLPALSPLTGIAWSSGTVKITVVSGGSKSNPAPLALS